MRVQGPLEMRRDRGERIGFQLACQVSLSGDVQYIRLVGGNNNKLGGKVLGLGSKTHLLASVVLSSLLPVPAAEYQGRRSCFVGARGMPRSESVIAGLDFEARAARAAVCSSRSAKRLTCPLLNGMSDPEATGVMLLLVSVLWGGEECGVIPARARSVLRRDSASWRGLRECERGERGEGTHCNESTICILCLFCFCSCLITTDTFDVVKSIGMIRLVVGDVEFAHRGYGARRSLIMGICH
jgi:hypothetical protein